MAYKRMNHSNTDKTERGHSMLFYTAVLELLESYFHIPGWKKLFLTGGCFWLSDYLHRGICPSVLMINRTEEHCALYFAHGLYDVTGKISEKNFHEAAKREISFMRKNYRPKFDTGLLETYLAEHLFEKSSAVQRAELL